jgi:hypothetical protein
MCYLGGGVGHVVQPPLSSNDNFTNSNDTMDVGEEFEPLIEDITLPSSSDSDSASQSSDAESEELTANGNLQNEIYNDIDHYGNASDLEEESTEEVEVSEAGNEYG